MLQLPRTLEPLGMSSDATRSLTAPSLRKDHLARWAYAPRAVGDPRMGSTSLPWPAASEKPLLICSSISKIAPRPTSSPASLCRSAADEQSPLHSGVRQSGWLLCFTNVPDKLEEGWGKFDMSIGLTAVNKKRGRGSTHPCSRPQLPEQPLRGKALFGESTSAYTSRMHRHVLISF